MEDLGKAVGVTAVTIFQWEKGKFFPKDLFLARLAKVLGTSVGFLCSGEQVLTEGRGSMTTNDKALKQVILTARRQIAFAASLPLESVRISLDEADGPNTALPNELQDACDGSEISGHRGAATTRN